jgi:hypothetical protein
LELEREIQMGRSKLTARKSQVAEPIPYSSVEFFHSKLPNMIQATPHGIIGTSPHGIQLDVLKSALQKYIRRQETDKAMTIIDEMYRVMNLKGEDEKLIRSLTTNFVNRLIIISVEDIGIGNVFVPIKLHSLISEFREHQDRITLRKMVYLLSESEKSREISHLRACFSSEPYPQGDQVGTTCEHPLVFETMFNLDKRELRKNFTKPKVEGLKDNELITKLYSVLLEWFKLTVKENKIFGYQIILLNNLNEAFFSYSEAQYNALLSRMETTDFKFESHEPIIEDYCVDKHTREGRTQGKDIETFHHEGALVHPESKFTNLQYKAIYENGKSNSTSSSSSSLSISFSNEVPRGQILTAKWKHYVFLPLDQPFVYKGPFSSKKGDKARIERLKARTKCIKLTIIEKFFSLPTFIETEQGTFLKFDNLSPIPSPSWKTTKEKGSFEPEEINVIERSSMGLRQLEFRDYDMWFGNTFFFRAFILAYILKIGDVGPWNCLLPLGKNPRMIDMEDVSTRKGESEVPFIFFSKFREKSIKDTFKAKFEEKKKDVISFCKELEPFLPEFDELMSKIGIKPSEEWKEMMDKLYATK